MLAEACEGWNIAPLFYFSECCTVWPWREFAGAPTSWKIGSCLECFPIVFHFSNLSHCRMMDFKLFGIALIGNPSQTDRQKQLLLQDHCQHLSFLALCSQTQESSWLAPNFCFYRSSHTWSDVKFIKCNRFFITTCDVLSFSHDCSLSS